MGVLDYYWSNKTDVNTLVKYLENNGVVLEDGRSYQFIVKKKELNLVRGWLKSSGDVGMNLIV